MKYTAPAITSTRKASAVFGSNAFLHFIPMPPMSGHAGEFIGSMFATGYLQVIGSLEVLGGLLLVIGRFVPLGLTLLGPIVVNIVLYHLFMDRNGMPMALIVAAFSLFLLWQYTAPSPAFSPMRDRNVRKMPS